MNGLEAPLNSAERLDTSLPRDLQQWQSISPLPFPRCDHCVVTVAEFIYVIGGRTSLATSSEPINSVLRYDTEAGSTASTFECIVYHVVQSNGRKYALCKNQGTHLHVQLSTALSMWWVALVLQKVCCRLHVTQPFMLFFKHAYQLSNATIMFQISGFRCHRCSYHGRRLWLAVLAEVCMSSAEQTTRESSTSSNCLILQP